MSARERRSAQPLPGVALALVGCDFRVASSSWRSALVLSADEREDLVARLRASAGAEGLAVLDTCNRTEWLVEAPRPGWAADLLHAWMLRRWRDLAPASRLPSPYVRVGGDAVRHWLRVALGMDSFVPGEREIAGQCSRALATARAAGAASPLIDELDRCAGRAVRRLERAALFRDTARGVHSVAADAIAGRLEGLGRPARVAVAGTGHVGRLVAELLEQRGLRVERYNRTPAAGVLPLSALPAVVGRLDALVVATAATSPPVAVAEPRRRERPLLVLDLGVPHQVARPVPEGVTLVGLDDLQLGAADQQDERDREVAQQAVDLGVDEFLLACARRASSRLLETLQRSREELRDERLPALLDEHAGDLEPGRRRKLEAALRGLMIEQHRRLVDEIERSAGLVRARTDPP